MTTRVFITIGFDLENVTSIPSEEVLGAAAQRAESAAARVFVNGDAGGEWRIEVEPGAHGVPKTCEAVNVLPCRINASVRREGKRKR